LMGKLLLLAMVLIVSHSVFSLSGVRGKDSMRIM
jgi:hypothetical protein